MSRSSEEQRRRDQEIRSYIIDRAFKDRDVDKAYVNHRAAQSVGRDILWMGELEGLLKRVFAKGKLPTASAYKGKRNKTTERAVNIVLSDLHYQSLLDGKEVPIAYGPLEESRRTGKIAAQVADYKRQYRKESKLLVHLLGDIIQNQLHDPRDGAPLTFQFAAALWYLRQLIVFWASEYPEVEVFCTPGNHGRIMSRHPERAVHQKWDAIETMIYLALKAAIQSSGLSNVKIHISSRPYYVVEVFGEKGFFTHGDTVLKPGYPGKKIDVAGLYEQIARFNAARHIKGPFSLFGVGHVHFGSITNMPGGVSMLTNGCLVPPDSFALSIGSPDVTCGQYMFESVEKHIVGDQRFINVDDADGEKGYSKLVRPFPGTL